MKAVILIDPIKQFPHLAITFKRNYSIERRIKGIFLSRCLALLVEDYKWRRDLMFNALHVKTFDYTSFTQFKPKSYPTVNEMKTSSFLGIAVLSVASIYHARASSIQTSGVPTSCGEHDCCIPSCIVNWIDSNGCNGQASVTGACTDAFDANTDTNDDGVDICDGSGAFFCTTDGGVRVIYVVNRDNEVSAALWPAVYNECTLSGQCAPCDLQGSCQDPVTIGTSTTHNCATFAALLTSSNVDLQPC